MADWGEDVFATVGGTPLVRLQRVVPAGAAEVLVKLESLNPTGSVKDRVAPELLVRCERAGLKPGGHVVEATSGNTGIALAWLCARRGYRFTAVVPDAASKEVLALLRAYGAEVVKVRAEAGLRGLVERAKEIAKSEGAFVPGQFERLPESIVLAQEIHDQLGHADRSAWSWRALLQRLSMGGGTPPAQPTGRPPAPHRLDAFVCGAGSGGTLHGVAYAQFRRDLWRGDEPRVISVQVAARGENDRELAARVAGIAWGPDGKATADRQLAVEPPTAFEWRARLAREEGILAGLSSGAVVAVAVSAARELGAGKRIVAILADSGERYFSAEEAFA
jgi:cysteine synthase A